MNHLHPSPARRRAGGRALLAGIAAALGPALASPSDPIASGSEHYFGAGLIVVQPDGGRGADDGNGAGLLFAGQLGERRWWEARVFSNVLDTGSRTAVDFYQTGLGVDLVQPLGEITASHPFVLLGIGGTINDVTPASESGTGTFVNAAIGWRGATWQSWGVRPRIELRTLYDTFDAGNTDVQISLMMEIPPRPTLTVRKTVEVEKRVEVPVEVVKIVEKPVVCVVPPVEGAAAPTAAGPADADADGIPDDQDRCPLTLAGAKVGLDGCVQEEQVINLPNIEFEPGSTRLSARGRAKLDPVAAFLQNQSGVRLEVAGHTDAQGAEAYNLKLSEDRARAVRTTLVELGIDGGRLSSVGFGETRPIASNETAEGRAANRRVELRISTGE